MKLFLFLAALTASIFSAQGQEQEKHSYVFFYADVESDGVVVRYFSPILDQPVTINEKCLTDKARESLVKQAGAKAVIESIELESSGTFEEAEDLLLNTYTLPNKKVAYFKLEPDC